MKNRYFSIGFIAFFLAAFCFGSAAPASAKANPRYAALVIDADTGVVLSQENADKPLHPASLTKIMTLLMIFEAMEAGRLGLKDRISISRRAAGMAPSKLGIAAGSSIRVQDAIGAIVTKSANDIAVAVGEHIGGSEKNFARMMTNRARSIGMRGTVFTNASGLHDKRQVSTARDMATLARHVINRYPGYYRYFSTANFSYGGRSYHNHNRLMETYRGMDGMKTGYIEPSGFNLVASAVRGDRRLIGVVFGGRSAATRNAHMASLLDKGFASSRSSSAVNIAEAVVKAAPLPPRKPVLLTALDSAAPLTTPVLKKAPPVRNPQIAMAEMLRKPAFTEAMGQGDSDPAESRRIETGLMAVNAMKGRELESSGAWAIQVGAFASRVATDKAIADSMKKLPVKLASVSPMIAPLKTKDGWMFRARLNGFSRGDAFHACKYLSECIPVAPANN